MSVYVVIVVVLWLYPEAVKGTDLCLVPLHEIES